MNKIVMLPFLFAFSLYVPFAYAQGGVNPQCPEDKVKKITAVYLNVDFTSIVTSIEEGSKSFKDNIQKFQSLVNEYDKKYAIELRDHNYSLSHFNPGYPQNALQINNSKNNYNLYAHVSFSLNNEDAGIKIASKLEQMGFTPNLTVSFTETQCFNTYEEVQDIK